MSKARPDHFETGAGGRRVVEYAKRSLNRVAHRAAAATFVIVAAIALVSTLGALGPQSASVTGAALAQDASMLERPATMRRQVEQRPFGSEPYLVKFDQKVFEHQLPYEDGHFAVPEGGVYHISASAYIEGATARRLEVRVYGQDTTPSGENWKQQYVLEQTQAAPETDHNSTVVGTIALKVDRGDRISIWVSTRSNAARIAATPNSNWVSICQINRQR